MARIARNTTPPVLPTQGTPESKGTERVLLALLGEKNTQRGVDLALAVAGGTDATVRIVRPVVVPEQTPLSLPDPILAADRETADAAFHATVELPSDVPVVSGIRVGHSVPRIVASVVTDSDIDVVVLDALQGERERSGFSTLAERVGRAAGCDVVTANGIGEIDRLASLLVPVAGGPHSGFAVDVAAALARTHGAWIDLIHVIDPAATGHTAAANSGDRAGSDESDGNDRCDENGDNDDRGGQYLRAALDRFDDTERVDARTIESEDPVGTIVAQSRCYDCTVLGAPRKGRLRRFVGGSTTDDVCGAEATGPVLTVRRAREGPWYRRWVHRREHHREPEDTDDT